MAKERISINIVGSSNYDIDKLARMIGKMLDEKGGEVFNIEYMQTTKTDPILESAQFEIRTTSLNN